MKKGILALLLILTACTPVRYVYVDQKDSVVKRQRIVYDNLYVPSVMPLNYLWYRTPYYNPIIIRTPIRIQPRYTPQKRYTPQPRYTPQRQLPHRAPRIQREKR